MKKYYNNFRELMNLFFSENNNAIIRVELSKSFIEGKTEEFIEICKKNKYSKEVLCGYFFKEACKKKPSIEIINYFLNNDIFVEKYNNKKMIRGILNVVNVLVKNDEDQKITEILKKILQIFEKNLKEYELEMLICLASYGNRDLFHDFKNKNSIELTSRKESLPTVLLNAKENIINYLIVDCDIKLSPVLDFHLNKSEKYENIKKIFEFKYFKNKIDKECPINNIKRDIKSVKI